MRVLAGRYCTWLVPSGVRDPRHGASHKRGVFQAAAEQDRIGGLGAASRAAWRPSTALRRERGAPQ